MKTIKKLNEEIARWAFEVHLKNNKSCPWFISYTNPTAGPWKTVKAQSLGSQEIGDVYNFKKEENRPDLILYNDNLKVVLIIEAKCCIKELIDTEQINKTASVVKEISKELNSLANNQFWKGREDYNVIVGLLWGSIKKQEEDYQKNQLYTGFHNVLINMKHVYTDLIIGIEALYQNDKMRCSFFYREWNQGLISGKDIVHSFTAPKNK